MNVFFSNNLKNLLDNRKDEVKLDSTITFSEQISLSGARKFSNMDQDLFYDWYIGNTRKCHYEVITLDKPKKLFLDIDLDKTDTDIVSLGELVINLIKFSSVCITRLTGIEINREDWLLLNSSSETKGSFHAVLAHEHLRFQSITNMKSLVLYLIDSFETEIGPLTTKKGSSKKIVDTGCYSNNQNLRLIFSSKLGSSRTLEVDDRDENILTHTDEDVIDITKNIFKSSLITSLTNHIHSKSHTQ